MLSSGKAEDFSHSLSTGGVAPPASSSTSPIDKAKEWVGKWANEWEEEQSSACLLRSKPHWVQWDLCSECRALNRIVVRRHWLVVRKRHVHRRYWGALGMLYKGCNVWFRFLLVKIFFFKDCSPKEISSGVFSFGKGFWNQWCQEGGFGPHQMTHRDQNG